MSTYGSLQNQLMGHGATTRLVQVGDGATEVMWTDRHAYTVIQVVHPGRVVVQRDTATRTDNLGMSDSQSYAFSPDPHGPTAIVRRGADGVWRTKGGKAHGRVFLMGHRDEHYDYSF